MRSNEIDITKYRQLKAGEIIRKGDLIDACRDGWRDPANWQPVEHRIDQEASDPAYPSHSKFLRRLTIRERIVRWFKFRQVDNILRYLK